MAVECGVSVGAGVRNPVRCARDRSCVVAVTAATHGRNRAGSGMRGKHGQSALGASLESLDFYGFSILSRVGAKSGNDIAARSIWEGRL